MKLTDTYHRQATYLRLAVTDRCNLRCRYCMPSEGIDFSDRKDLLSFEEIVRVSKIFKSLGINKVRLTGGEPFVRRGFDDLLRDLSNIFPNVHITTNATLIHEHFDLLDNLQISGLNISIDSLNREKFNLITRRESYDTVMENIITLSKMDIPTKLNIVVMKDINDHEIIDFIKFGMKYNLPVRFIEAMPFNQDDGNKSVFLSAMDILSCISAVYPKVKKQIFDFTSSSESYIIANNYTFGIIPAYTRSLCASCDRIRMTPKGEMLTCLYSESGLNLRDVLRDTSFTNKDIEHMIVNKVKQKLKSGHEEEHRRADNIFSSMTSIGG